MTFPEIPSVIPWDGPETAEERQARLDREALTQLIQSIMDRHTIIREDKPKHSWFAKLGLIK